MIARRLSLLTLALLAMLSQPCHSQTFHEDFNAATLDPAIWSVAGGGTVSLSGGQMSLSAGCGEVFPYVSTVQNPFPATGDFLIQVRFTYPLPQTGGNGFGAKGTWNNPFVFQGFAVWQDFCCGGLRMYLGDGQVIPIAGAPETTEHLYEWRYVSGIYYAYVDGVLKGMAPSNYRPTGIFIGHPPTSYCPWTQQRTDYVHVEPLNTTAGRRQSWAHLKQVYR